MKDNQPNRAKPDHHPLEAAGLEWLRFARACHIVTRERGQYGSRPDLLAVNAKRYLIEVEIKRTLSDFKRDAIKPHRATGSPHVRQLFYLVPQALVDKVMPHLPPRAGLLTLGRQTSIHTGLPEVSVIKQAAPRRVLPLNDKAIWRLTRDMASALVSAEIAARRHHIQ